MTVSRIRAAAFAGVAAAFLTSCSGVEPSVTPPRSATTAARPDARAALLYVSDTATSDVYVYSYPQGKLRQTLTGFADPAGECVDKSGNVFIANTGGSNIVEYAHGGSSPIATLKDKGYFPLGCSVDPATGNLAVTNFSTTGSAAGNIVIYKNAKGRARRHYSYASMYEMLLCGYDAAGNLFVDGLTQSYGAVVSELPHGKARMRGVALDRSIYNPGGIQWDGKHVAIGDQSSNTIYQFRVKNGKAKTVSSTTLGGATMVFAFWIDGNKVIGPDAGAADVGVWRYPQGGAAVKTIGGVYVPLGTTISR